MSYKDYETAIKLIEENKDLKIVIGGCSLNLICLAESKLNLKFPNSYKEFLMQYGALCFGAEEIYGIVKEDFEKSEVPDSIWYTLLERRVAKMPDSLLVIYDTGSEELFCLDFNNLSIEGEPTVVVFVPGVDLEYQSYEIIAEDFGQFLLDRVKIELNI
jgi:hypothetical protein